MSDPIATTAARVAGRARSLPRRGVRAARARWRTAAVRRRVADPGGAGLLTLGDLGYGGYQVPADLLGPQSRVLCAGAGTDTSFESLLVDRFGCRVHLLDPVPEAAEHARAAFAHEPRVTFEEAALWDVDTDLTFHEPAVPGHVSHSATDLHRTPASFVARGRRVASLRAEHGWPRIDLLKISAEGSEFAVLDDVLAGGEPVTAICVEFAHPADPDRVAAAVSTLDRHDYRIVARSTRPYGWKMTFRTRAVAARAGSARTAAAGV